MGYPDFWLGMTTNDRMGASIPHFHTHITLSIFKPKNLISKIEKNLISCVAETKNFKIYCSHDSAFEIIAISKNKFNSSDLTMVLDKKNIIYEISTIKIEILKLLRGLFKFEVPLIEGMFLKCNLTHKPTNIIYVITPFKNEGCLEKYRGGNFSTVYSEQVCSLIRENIRKLDLSIEATEE